MNSESSRAHTVIQVEIKQIETYNGKKAQKLSVINLIDLAGSEKAGQTGATGDRLKEGCQINQSLSCLGDVIKALVDKQNGKKQIVIPYRNSNLTRMLQNALGGNSKTYMICAIRPGAKYFEETVSTLKYADRAKQIKNKAVVNENPQDKMIRELKAENDKLKKQLAEAGGPAQVVTKEDEESKAAMLAMKEQLEANQRAMLEMEKSWEDKVAEAKLQEQEAAKIREAEEASFKSDNPHLLNLNEDPLLDRKVVYDIKSDEKLTCGRRGKDVAHKLQLGGMGIEKDHCYFETQSDGSVKLFPNDHKAGLQVRVNGMSLSIGDPVLLKPNDRICIGPSAMFLFKHRAKEFHTALMPDHDDDPITFDFASEEVVKVQQQVFLAMQANQKEEDETKAQKKIKELEAKMEEERLKSEEEINKKMEEMAKLSDNKERELALIDIEQAKLE